MVHVIWVSEKCLTEDQEVMLATIVGLRVEQVG